LRVRNISPKLVARYAYTSEACDLRAIPEFREHASGWTWLARVKDDRCQCVQLSLDPNARPPDPPPPFPAARFRGADVTWRWVPGCAGPGYFLCGDAAAVLDPAASSGVARALASGLKAADLIADVCSKKLDAGAAAADYRRWCANQFVDQATQLAARYAELAEPPAWLQGLGGQFAELDQFPSNLLAKAENSVITS
jgi:2-polyprenyl-6-methoxyphenol hydroxylase-like FAD-dependent oxidoreductase